MNEIWVTTRSFDRAKHGGHLLDDADSIPPYKKAFAWPTVGRLDDGTLMVGSSGTDPEDH